MSHEISDTVTVDQILKNFCLWQFDASSKKWATQQIKDRLAEKI